MRRMWMLVAVLVLALVGAGCEDDNGGQAGEVKKRAAKQKAYLPKNDVELRNYNEAQKLYDSPNTIIWCSTTWGNPSSPIVTVPIAGKLTSSSTTFFRPQEVINNDSSGSGVAVTARSVDGLFHPNPPGYRYGFTPGGQYVDFFNMDTICTTALTKFQRESTEVSTRVDREGERLARQAEQALADGDRDEAQRILDALNEGG